jgi:hypothetical protein
VAASSRQGMAKGLPPPIYPSPLSIIPLLFYGLYILNWYKVTCRGTKGPRPKF